MADLKQTFVWVAVPNGVSGNVLRLSVIVYPRLFVLENGQPAAGTVPLVQFRDLLEWPGRSEGVQFDVQFGDLKPVKAKKVSRKPEMPSWMLLFQQDTPVECYDQPHSVTESTLAYPATAMYSFLKDQYKRAGQQFPWAPPLAETLAEGFGDVAPAIFAANQQAPKLRDVWETFRGGTSPMNYVDDRHYGKDPARDWLLTKLFFRPGKVETVGADTAKLSYPDPVEEGTTTSTAPEFHKMIAMLAFHAEMARTFGLIIDLEVDRPAGMPAASTVKLIPKWSPTGKFPTTNACPVTHYSAAFLPAPKAFELEEINDGIIDLSQPRYQVIQAELDNALVSLEKLVERLPNKVGESVALPPLGSGGLILMRQSAAQRQVAQRKLYNSNYDQRVNHPEQLDVWAEDLLMGYRLDIWSDRSSRWHSLHQRHATYQFTTGNKPTYFDYDNEGWVNPAFGEVDAGLVTENVMSPFLARWTGWSLSAPKEPEQDWTKLVDPNMKFGVRYSVTPGSLPWLRYGITYRLKMRTLDLAGNGQPFNPSLPAAVPGATQPLTYRRFEPVGTPFVILREQLSQGESLPRLVIRDSDPTTPAERHIAPPQTSVAGCEAHGLFDTASGLDPNKVADAEERYEITPPGEYAGAELPVDYLADYFARGAALLNVPGASGPVHVPFGDAWPERRSFRLLLESGNAAPQWDLLNRTLTVFLPPAGTARVRLSSHFGEGDLDQMALWHWLKEGLSGAPLVQMRQGLLDGRHWATTPGRELVLVHAVQKPLASPDFTTIGALRGLGETSATISGVIAVDGKSTGKVAVRVQWVEPVDDLEADKPGFVGGRGHAFQAKIGSSAATSVGVESKFDFRDTKYRRVQVTATGTSRFTDFYPKGTDSARQGNPIEVDVLNTARPLAPRVQYVVPTFGWEQPQQASGSSTVTRTRWGGGLRVYLDRPWYSTGDGEMLAVILYDEQTKTFFRRPETPENVAPWVTIWGADPLWKSGDLYPYPKLEHFKSALSTQAGLKLPEAGDAAILVAGHSVKYDEGSQRWYCDIELDAGPAYFPFIRLALARFQPRSVSGAHLSPVVTTEIVQIAPNRTATVTKSATEAKVAVAGQTYTTGRAGSAVVRVSLEAGTQSGGMLAWSPQGTPVTLKREGLAWTGTVPLPAGPSGTSYRLVIREYERLLSDAGVAERLVYADAIEI
jgi:hypothetical protein